MRAFHRCFLPTFSLFDLVVLEAYLSVIQFIVNCILLISIFISFSQKNSFFKAYNHKHELPVAAMCVNGSGRNEHSLWRTFHRWFLPYFSSFGWGVSEEKIKMWKLNGRRTTDAKWWQKLTKVFRATFFESVWNFLWIKFKSWKRNRHLHG